MKPLRPGLPMPQRWPPHLPPHLPPPPRPSRRALLAGAAGLGLAAPLGLPALLGPGARAAAPAAPPVSPGQRRFLFLTCFGGWDPTRALVPAFDDPAVDMEAGAVPYTVGGLTFVDHPGRPRARACEPLREREDGRHRGAPDARRATYGKNR